MGKFRNIFIKALGGYTKKEYNRVEMKYQGLLDSRTDNQSTFIANEYIMRVLEDLDKFAKKELYGIPSDNWASRMFNVIHNNYLRVLIRYVHTRSNVLYRLDTTLDTSNVFSNVLKEENNENDLFILNNKDWEI